MFSRLPVPGQVKTRLAPMLSPALAADLQWALLRHAFKVAVEADAKAEVWLNQIPEQAQHWECCVRLQPSGDLGARMAHASDAAFAAGQTSLIIGSDCPMLDRPYIQRAIKALATGDVVLGPTRDGGYALVALPYSIPDIFVDMPWSTDQVLAQTKARLDALGIKYRLLFTLDDIDEPAQLQHFLNQKGARRILGPSLYQQFTS